MIIFAVLFCICFSITGPAPSNTQSSSERKYSWATTHCIADHHGLVSFFVSDRAGGWSAAVGIEKILMPNAAATSRVT